MADRSKIEWTDATWNPITGCSVVSPGCTNCYAMRLAGGRMQHHWSREGLTEPSKAGPVWNGEVRFNEPWLDQPLRWKRPRTIFVAAHGDLFHESVPDEWIDRVFEVMEDADRHRFQVLTKRAERMRDFLERRAALREARNAGAGIPSRHIWLGVSAEDQKRADERIPILLETPAAVRFLSAEPLLGPINLRRVSVPDASRELWLDALTGCHTGYAKDGPLPQVMAGLDWVIAGGESGPGARPMHPDWARSLRDQCAIIAAFHFKQWGEWSPRPLDHIPVPFERLRWMLPDGTVKRVEHITPKENELPWQHIARVGKNAAGRALDGRTWDGIPA